MTDLYSILGVPKTATQDEIKSAYRRAAMRAHPDREGGSEEAFKTIQRAGEVLLDAASRAEYDATGRVPGEEPTLQDRVLAMLDDILDKMGHEDFGPALAKLKEGFAKDQGRLSQELVRAKANLRNFEESVKAMPELTPELAALAAARTARLRKKVTEAESSLEFLEETKRILSPVKDQPTFNPPPHGTHFTSVKTGFRF